MVDVIVRSPKRIKSIEAVDEILSRIDTFEKERNCRAGVLFKQMRLFGAGYIIKSEEESKEWLAREIKINTPEWGIEYYPRSYFEELKSSKLQSEPQTKVFSRYD